MQADPFTCDSRLSAETDAYFSHQSEGTKRKNCGCLSGFPDAMVLKPDRIEIVRAFKKQIKHIHSNRIHKGRGIK